MNILGIFLYIFVCLFALVSSSYTLRPRCLRPLRSSLQHGTRCFFLSHLQVAYKRPTPPSQPLVVRSQVVKIVDGGKVGLAKQAVGVEVQLYALQPNGLEDLLATVEGLFKRHGALRAL